MGLIDQIDTSLVFFDSDSFPGVESLTFYPRSGTSRTIKAMVDRVDREGVGPIQSIAVLVTVQNDATLGISSSAMNVGGDELAVSARSGATARRLPLPPPEQHDDKTLRFRFMMQG